jgi:hypothetical protein
MKATFVSVLAVLALAATAHGQVPSMLSYQGQVAVNGTNFSGNGSFKFALVNNTGATSFWSNDGTSIAGSQPANAVTLSVANGLYSAPLGDVSLANMQAVPSGIFTNTDVRLRIWFNDGTNGWQQLSPDQRVLSVGYSMMAELVPDGSITAGKLANGAVTSGKIANDAIGAVQIAAGAVNSSDIADGSILGVDLANLIITTSKLVDGAVTSEKLADDIDLGSAAVNGSLDVFRTAAGTPSISLNGGANMISVFGDDGSELSRLWGVTWGELLLRDSVGHEIAARLTANANSGGRLYLYNSNGLTRALVSGENAGGVITLYKGDGSGTGALLDGNNNVGAGQITLYQNDGNTGAALYGDDGNGSGALSLRKANGNPGLRFYGGPSSGSMFLYNTAGELNLSLWSYDGEEGVVSVKNKFGNETIYLWGRDSGDVNGGQIGLKESDGTETLTLQASEVAGNGAQIVLRKSDGTATVVLDADQGGEGRITTQVLQITGGADLSEQFDINSASHTLEPGMIVSIDPENPGELKLTTHAFDRNVAGIVSGAGGVKPGMLMGQVGTAANGKHPVALTGRVYCQVDASHGAIRPGDLITTSDTPGHGMKATNPAQAQGAIIGKAMTALESGKGLVLVLVSLQ